eukprot:GHVP01002068.1.p1 GENE.GHVP01002068.1~~GHVP01002068.1.p1  ORF type:complete len:318 (+),score=48.57 GHVP01002068.1:1721-2674(+)
MVSIVKSPNDTREYRYLTLKNGLKVVLIREKSLGISGASFSVFSGSKNDGDTPGIAHFVEHLLFMGSEKFPEEAAYRDYINEHCGTCNAFTAYEDTNYYFEIPSGYFFGALNILTQFFVSPLFRKGSIERERQALNSEYKADLKSNSRRVLHVIKEVSNSAHPYNNFSCGNIETLQNDNVLIKEFYRNFYRPDIISVAIYSDKELDILEEKVTEQLLQIQNTNESKEVDNKHTGEDLKKEAEASNTYINKSGRLNGYDDFPITKEAACQEVYIESIEKNTEMTFLFQTPHYSYKRRPMEYIVYIVTSEESDYLFGFL